MNWVDKIRHELQQAQLEMETMKGAKCHFCNKSAVTKNTFQGYVICNECNEKLADRVKLILKFE